MLAAGKGKAGPVADIDDMELLKSYSVGSSATCDRGPPFLLSIDININSSPTCIVATRLDLRREKDIGFTRL